MRGRNRSGALRLTPNQAVRRTMAFMEAMTPPGKSLDDLRRYVTPAPQPRAKATHPEHDAQVSLVRWWFVASKQYRVPHFALMAIPNGGRRGMVEAQWLKAEGMRPGALDLVLAVPRGNYHGLWIEMKIKPNSTSADQDAMLEYLNGANYKATVCWSDNEAIKTIEEYMR